jgi:hypothetical protein
VSDDRDVLAELGELLRRVDPVPDEVRVAAEEALDLAFLPPSWTRLEPVAEPTLMRAGARSFRFGDKETFVKVDVRGPALVGVVFPITDVEVCWPSGSRRVRPDESGLFQVDDLASGPLRVIVGRTRVTRWFWP